MPRLPHLALLCSALLATGIAAAKNKDPFDRLTPVPAGEQIPAFDFFRPALFTRPALNPDGTKFAALVTVEGEKQYLLICDIASGKLRTVGGSADRDIYSFMWLTPERLVSKLSEDKRYAFGMYVTNIKGADLVKSYPVEQYSVTRTIGIPRKTPENPIVWVSQNAYDSGKDGGILKIDTDRSVAAGRDELAGSRGTSGSNSHTYGMQASVVRSYPRPVGGAPVGYMADLEGELAYGFTAANGLRTLHSFADGKWSKTAVDLEKVDIVGLGEKPGELLVMETGDAEKPRPVRRLDVASNALGETVFEDPQYDFADAVIFRQPLTNRIVGVGLDRARWQNFWFDRKYADIQASVEAQFPQECVGIMGSDEAEKRFFIAAWSDRKPVAYYMADLEKGSFGLIKSTRPWIDPARMRPANVVRYKARDGREIEGYLTLPAGASKANPAPLLVYPHGGPWVRDTWEWDAVAQFFASRGYAVFQPNYRGSDSYSWRFPAEDMWAFRKMHEDVTAGVAAMKRTGLIDGDRVAIMGGSFGGYLALCGAAFEPDTYRCAVTMAGVFDWARMIKEVSRLDDSSIRNKRLLRKLGDPAKNQARFDEISPIRHLDAVRIPIFVSHGTDDQVVDVAQSKRLVNELESRKIPHEAFFPRGEGHGMAFVENRVELYTRIERFLAANLAPRTAPATASAGAPAATP